MQTGFLFPDLFSYLRLSSRGEPITPAHRRNLEMKRGMLWMPALVQQRLWRLLLRQNAHQHIRLRVVLAKVAAQSALPIMNGLHIGLLLRTQG